MRTSTTRTTPITLVRTGKGGEPPGRRVALLGRIAGWCFDHRIKAVGLWLAALFTIFGAAGAVGSRFSSSSAVPDSGSAAGFAVLQEHFPDLGTGGQSGTIVFRARQGVDDPGVRAAMESLFTLVDAGFPDRDGVPEHPGGTVVSPYSEGGTGQIARTGPLAHQVAYAQVNLSTAVDDTGSGLLGQAISAHAPIIEGLEDLREIKLFGLGLALAVLLDATPCPHGGRAGHHGAARRPQLVAPEVARPAPAPPSELVTPGAR